MSRATEVHNRSRLAATVPAPLKLTPAEAAMLAVFRAMDDRAKSDVTKLATRLARLNPHRHVPQLRLITGGKS
jgi:hypothetical protein